MAHHAGGAHIAPAFSMTDILVALFEKALNLSAKNLSSPDRDRFVLSKGHACAALYAVLAERGFLKKSELKTFCSFGSRLGGHPERGKIPGVEASTGSLGHGFPIACGMALAGKLSGKKYKVYTILGDGECQEGVIWEAAMFASQQRLDNLIAIVDFNKLQGIGRLEEISDLKPFRKKWESFGWQTKEIDGHDFKEITGVFKKVPFKKGYPSVIIAHTVKGRGVSFMESKPIWHYRLPDAKEMLLACKELGIENIEAVLE